MSASQKALRLFAEDLSLDKGNYTNYVSASGTKLKVRTAWRLLMTSLKLAKEQLAPYGVKVMPTSLVLQLLPVVKPETTGIGQDFAKMAE